MNNITYLFGAGASKNALPIVNEMPERIGEMLRILKGRNYQLSDKENYKKFKDIEVLKSRSKLSLQNEILHSLKWLQTECAKHASVDTLAKKYYIKEDFKSLTKLKIVLSVYFIFEQAYRPVDLRYDAFYASILDSISEFPKNISIISWNYDYQFELAFSEYSDTIEVSKNQSRLHVREKHARNVPVNGFGIFKLNGTTALMDQSRIQTFFFADKIKGNLSIELMDNVTRNYALAMHTSSVFPTLSFAWENEIGDEPCIEMACNHISQATVLVVIGYSFPFFNREIDKKIIESMPKLKKVYFQSPDAENLKERFHALTKNPDYYDLVSRHDVSQFLLPNEL